MNLSIWHGLWTTLMVRSIITAVRISLPNTVLLPLVVVVVVVVVICKLIE